MAATFYSQLLHEYDWEKIQREARQGPVYLGNVISLTPSGKYYVPFASNNITRTEAKRDESWWKALEKAADKYLLSVITSPDDPTDIFVVDQDDPWGAF